MKISIVNPVIPVFQRGYAFRKSRKWQPLSPAIVGAFLEQQGGWEIQFIDAHVEELPEEETIRRVREFAPDVVYYSSERTDAWELPIPDTSYMIGFLGRLTDGWKPDLLVMEGPHASIFPEDILSRAPMVDVALRGEPEPVSMAFLGRLGKGEDWSDLPAISYRRGDELIHNPDDPDPVKYADFPSPAWHLLPMEKYVDAAAPGTPFAMLETSRGCPMPCGYCYKQMFGDRQSKRDPEQVLDEVQEVVEKYGVRRIMFQDQIFTLDRRHTTAICEGLIARGLAPKIEWRCQTRLNGMKNELLKLMKDAGCAEIYTGLETGSDEIQGEISKLTLEEFLQYRSYGESIGLKVSPNMILGLPGETESTALESVMFYHRLGIPMSPNVNITYPMTRYYEEAVERGDIRGGSWEEVVDAAGLVGTHMDKPTIDRVRAKAAKLNRILRWKKKLWNAMGKTYGQGAAKKLLAARGRTQLRNLTPVS